MNSARASEILALAEQAGPELRGSDAATWIRHLEPERQDVDAAIEWFLAQGEAPKALRIAAAMWPAMAATAVMAAVIVPLDQAIAPAWPSLVACGAAGGATYLGVLWLVARDALMDLRAKLRPAAPPAGDLTVVRETDVIA
jgi:hypothetical protein